jgi:hypothetical protein
MKIDIGWLVIGVHHARLQIQIVKVTQMAWILTEWKVTVFMLYVIKAEQLDKAHSEDVLGMSTNDTVMDSVEITFGATMEGSIHTSVQQGRSLTRNEVAVSMRTILVNHAERVTGRCMLIYYKAQR